MSDYSDFKEISREKRAFNREASARILREEGIPFTTNNKGEHLMVVMSGIRVDFWPGTGRWKLHSGKTGFGVFKLIKELRFQTAKALRETPDAIVGNNPQMVQVFEEKDSETPDPF